MNFENVFVGVLGHSGALRVLLETSLDQERDCELTRPCAVSETEDHSLSISVETPLDNIHPIQIKGRSFMRE